MTYSLKSCVWEITLACCFSCKYCGSSGGRARAGELTTRECLDVVQQLSELGCRTVSLIGGEVFMRPDWKTIASALARAGIRVHVITNGFLFTPALLADLKEVPVSSVAVSLDGPEALHDKFRQPGSFARAERAIDALAGAGIPVSVISTLNAETVPVLPDFYRWLQRKPIFAWQLQACSPMGNAAKYGIPYAFDFQKVIDFVGQTTFLAPFPVGIADNIGYFTEEEGFLRGDRRGGGIFRGCRAGLTSIGIDSVGNVRGCESLYDPRFNEGNLREKTLREIWESPTAFSYNRQFTRDLLTGACASCPEGWRCGGGCRSYNHFVHGRLYESPACARKGESS